MLWNQNGMDFMEKVGMLEFTLENITFHSDNLKQGKRVGDYN